MPNIDKFVFFKSDVSELVSMDFTPEEMFELLENSIKHFDWLKVAKCIVWIQHHPNSIYIKPLCLILTEHTDQFHPEEAVDALSDVLEETESEEQMIFAAKVLGKIVCIDYNTDPSRHVNIKCLAILHWLAGLNRPVSRVALSDLMKASKCNIPKVVEEANECLEDLSIENS